MVPPPETIRTTSRRVACDGSGDIPAALGHPLTYLEIDDSGAAECGYCDRRFVLVGGAADAPHGSPADSMPGDIEKSDEDSLGR